LIILIIYAHQFDGMNFAKNVFETISIKIV
jgi:hypothetical protein